MPWRECDRVSERQELVFWADREGANVSALSRQFGVSRKTAHKWLRRASEGDHTLADHNRRPHRSPGRTPPDIEAQICELRRENPAWGGRKLAALLRQDGVPQPPAPSTITGILARHDLLAPDRRKQRAWQRFEADQPNELWQMDFKGHVATARGRCHPLTVLDDHSRFNVGLAACSDERAATVQGALTAIFQRYGMPHRMLMDNGAPWGAGGGHPHTQLTAWLMRLDIDVSHGQPYHPQTQGKDERFHRTLKSEVLARRATWADLAELQRAFDAWRLIYNFRRPHEALADRPPATRYAPSRRPFPSALPPIAYASDDVVRKVQQDGEIYFRGKEYQVGKAFRGQPVALRATDDGVWDVYYCRHVVSTIDLASPEPVSV